MIITEGDAVAVSGIYDRHRNGIGSGSNKVLQPLEIKSGGKAKLEATMMGYRKGIRISLLLSALACIVYFVAFVY